MTNIQQYFDLPLNYAVTTHKGFICGIEYEIEDIKDFNASKIFNACFQIKDDSSLRNNGKEFISAPGSYKQQIERLREIKQCIVCGPEAFSERTSTHVHVNVSQLTLKQLNSLMLLYALFEPVFFDFVGEGRANSIYCVPLSYTYLPNSYHKGIASLIKQWHKYTAFNLCRVVDIGTVEFRHLYGTLDEDVISAWLLLLKRLYLFVENTPDFYIKQWFLDNPKNPVSRLGQHIFCLSFEEDMFKNTILDVKASFIGK